MKTIVSILLTVIFYKHVFCYLRVCYYTNWSQYRPNGGKFTPDDIDPKLCSHIIYAFGKLAGNTLVPFEWNDESSQWSMGMYDKVNNLKSANPDLRTLLAVGGWNAGSLPFSDMVSTRAFRKQFINSTLYFLRKRNFDGLDMDWEYPARRGGRPEDKANLVLLLAEMKQAFEQESYHNGKPRLLLTAAVPAGKSNIDAGYDIPNIARSLDFINIMTYDLHGSWEAMTGHNSPLFGRATESAADAILNMKWAVKYWAQRGAPKHKLIVGIGLYGRSFKLQSPTSNGIGAPAVGAGLAGRYTREPGFMSYYEVCEELQKGATRVWQAEHRAPYLHNGDLWVGYDDEESVTAKVRWMKQNKYGGIMVWSLALDDFSGQFCNKGRYPLLTAINKELGTIQHSRLTPVTTANVTSVIGNSQSSPYPSQPTLPPTLPVTALTFPEISLPNTVQTLPPEILSTGSTAAIPPPPPIFQSNSGNTAAVQAIGDLLLHGTTKLSPPTTVNSDHSHIQSGVANTHSLITQPPSLPVSISDPGNIASVPPPSTLNANPVDTILPSHNNPFSTHLDTSNLLTPLNVMQNTNMQNAITELLAAGGPLTVNNEQTPPFIASQPANSVLTNLTESTSISAIPSEFMHGHHPATSGGLHQTGNSILDPVLTNTFAQIPPEPALLSVPQQDLDTALVPAAVDMVPVPASDPAIVLPDSVFGLSSGLPADISPSTGSGTTGGGLAALNGPTVPLVVGSLPVVEQPVIPGIVAEPISSVGMLGSSPSVNLPVAAAAHSDIGLASVRPAPPSRPRLNFSFSSSSSSNSSSSSSSSSSNSSQNSSFKINPGSSGSSLSPTIHDLLQRGPIDILPLPADGNILSVVDQNQGIVPGGTVEAVIPIDNIDSLAQVLANLQTSIPTSGTVLLPEPRNVLRPETVLRELDIGNILGSNIASPVAVERIPSQQRDIRLLRPGAVNIDNRLPSQSVSQNTLDNRLVRTRFIPPVNDRLSDSMSVPQRSQRSQASTRSRVFPVSETQLRRLVSRLGRETVRGLLRSRRIVLQPSLQRRQIIRRPVTRSRTPSLRNTLVRQRLPTRISPSTRNILTTRFRRPQRRNRLVSFDSNDLNLTPTQTTRRRQINSNRDIFSMLGL